MGEAAEHDADRDENRGRFRQSALTAWDSYRETGLHVTAKEADEWLASLGAGGHTPAPECHLASPVRRAPS